jgi:hypothetical protein
MESLSLFFLWQGKRNGKERRIWLKRTRILGFPLRIILTQMGNGLEAKSAL